MNITIISTILGFLSSSVPQIIQYFARRKELDYQLAIASLKVEAAKSGFELTQAVADDAQLVIEGNNLRSTDVVISGGKFIDALRASVRPVITYVLFGFFIGIKLFVTAVVILRTPIDLSTMKEVVNLIMDDNTTAITSTVIGYYFGTKALENMRKSSDARAADVLKTINKS